VWIRYDSFHDTVILKSQSDLNKITHLYWYVASWKIFGNLFMGHMWVTLCAIQWKWWLQDYESVTKLLCVLWAIWLAEKVITIFIISLYIHDIRSLACELYRGFPRSPLPQHISKGEKVSDMVLNRLIKSQLKMIVIANNHTTHK